MVDSLGRKYPLSKEVHAALVAGGTPVTTGRPGWLPIARRGAKCSHHRAESEHLGAILLHASKEPEELSPVYGVVAPGKAWVCKREIWLSTFRLR